jgi:hypothetical protein
MPSREEIYKAIDDERYYQDQLGADRTDSSEHTVGDYLTMLGSYLRKAQNEWTDNAGTTMSLCQIRKIAAIAVRCMEEHGAPTRQYEGRAQVAKMSGKMLTAEEISKKRPLGPISLNSVSAERRQQIENKD